MGISQSALWGNAVVLWLLLAALTTVAQDSQDPALEIPYDPAPANQEFGAVFHVYTSIGSSGDIYVKSVGPTEVVLSFNRGCGFLCPGASEYRAFPFRMPALSPGQYIVNFGDSFGLFELSVDIGVSPADPVKINGEIPEAYLPFSIEMLVEGKNILPGWPGVMISVDDNIIYIEHLSDEVGYQGVNDSVVAKIQGLPPGDYTVKTARRSVSGDVEFEYEFQFFIADATQTLPAFTLYNPGVEHFFVTADPDELDQVLSNGWYRSDKGFYVWPAEGPAPETTLPVCRFYSRLVNSHFYTASESECEFLKDSYSGWDYEGIAFRALVPVEGSCSSGTTPVWRLYNGRAAELDSNHRFVASVETYRAMIADGWIGEGVAFCSPPVSGTD